ncbi:MAG: hypothetical protein H0V95_14050 [Actinobacteria bacterium]|nr:hypothetical protein [Actinomycetota bacterium]
MPLADRLPEHLKTRRTAEAVLAPSAILLAGAGTAAAVLSGLPLLAAAGVGAIAYGIRVAFGLPRKKRAERIELASLPEPWRHFVREAIDAQHRYRRAVATAAEGPLRDRLNEIGVGIEQGVHECYRIARRGAALEGGLSSVDAASAEKQLSALINSLPGEAQEPLRRAHDQGKDITAAAEKAGLAENHVQTIEALEAQVASAGRLGTVAQDARDRLSLLDARLDEAVARAVELSLRAEDVAELGGLGGDVEELVNEMESLRVALEEAGRASRGGTGDIELPTAEPKKRRAKGGGTTRTGTA